jgi:hypothetical protein
MKSRYLNFLELSVPFQDGIWITLLFYIYGFESDRLENDNINRYMTLVLATKSKFLIRLSLMYFTYMVLTLITIVFILYYL